MNPEKANLPSRNKYWEERNADEKIEVLRDELARFCRIVTTQQETIYRLLSHVHGQEGRLLMPLHGAESNGAALGALSAGVFSHDNGIPHLLRTERERR